MKTDAELILNRKGIPYKLYEYPEDAGLSAFQIASLTEKCPDIVYKTLVCRGAGHHTYVCVIPCEKELDFQKICAVTGEKRIRLAPRSALGIITGGYEKGSCTPIGMKRNYPIILDISAKEKEKICLNGGRVGVLMEIRPSDLKDITGAVYEMIAKER